MSVGGGAGPSRPFFEVRKLNWADEVGDDDISRMYALKEEHDRVIRIKKRLQGTLDSYEEFCSEVDKLLTSALKAFNTHKDRAIEEDKIGYWKLRGSLFMISPTFVDEAIDALAKAVKLDPTDIKYWNELGEAYCVKGNFELSKKCFLSALEHEKNPNSFHNLSILSRRKQSPTQDDLNDGLNFAKEALSMDLSNTKSWAILGNAYMAANFHGGPDDNYAHLALNAYKHAEKGGLMEVDVRTNKFVIFKYLERYEEALDSLYPSLSRPDVEWKQRKPDFLKMLEYLQSVQSLVDKKGKIRPKKLNWYLQRLRTNQGPGEPSSSTSSCEASWAEDPMKIVGIIIWILCPDGSYPYTVGIITRTEAVFVITIYNLRRDKGFSIGDTLMMSNTMKTEIKFSKGDEYAFSFTKIRISNPTCLFVNGKRLTPMECNSFVFCSQKPNTAETDF